MKKVEPLRMPADARFRRKGAPDTLSAITIPFEQREMLSREALDIFTRCANAGKTFDECLSAILISGLDWGINMCDCKNQKAAKVVGEVE